MSKAIIRIKVRWNTDGNYQRILNMTSMFKSQIEKVDGMQDQMSDMSRKMAIVRKNYKEILDLENTVM